MTFRAGFLEDLVLVLTALTLIAGLAEVARRVGMKWIKTHVVGPLLETRDQVKTNGHVSNPPTLLDTVHNVRQDVADVQGAVAEAREAFRVAAVMFEGHVTASETDRALLWAGLRHLEAVHTASVTALEQRLADHLAQLQEHQ